MSNHSGSYMLNEVFHIMEAANILQGINPKSRYEFIVEIIKMSGDYDCNPGEILWEIGQRYKICYSCLEEREIIEEDGLCNECILL